eukprot:GHVS01093913.1.p1 GENE.GHVS01093913.1~~GHVS01093913.1.p1  ORF type:complete len:371 (-),score=115.27 GHVS01093913.1:154-1266(-)
MVNPPPPHPSVPIPSVRQHGTGSSSSSNRCGVVSLFAVPHHLFLLLLSILISVLTVAVAEATVPVAGDVAAALLGVPAGAPAAVPAGPAGKEEDPTQIVEELKTMLGMEAAEMKRRSDVVFDFIDTSKDGTLSEEELRQWITKVKEAVHKKQVMVEMHTIDKDGDNKVTFEEMKLAYADSDGEAANPDTLSELKKRFVAVDKDQDGALSLDEIGLLMNPGTDDELMTLELEEILAAQDKDKDRRISLEEFLMSDESIDPEEMEQYKAEFNTYDINKDGFIDESEIRKVVSEPHHQEVNDAVAELQKMAADGGDLTRSYWSDKFHKFVISGATDNGELLRYPKEYNLDLPFADVAKPKDEEEEESEHEEEL